MCGDDTMHQPYSDGVVSCAIQREWLEVPASFPSAQEHTKLVDLGERQNKWGLGRNAVSMSCVQEVKAGKFCGDRKAECTSNGSCWEAGEVPFASWRMSKCPRFCAT